MAKHEAEPGYERLGRPVRSWPTWRAPR